MDWNKLFKKVLMVTAGVVGAAGALTGATEVGIAVPAAVAGVAKAVVLYGTLFGVAAAGAGIKGMDSLHTPIGKDNEDPK